LTGGQRLLRWSAHALIKYSSLIIAELRRFGHRPRRPLPQNADTQPSDIRNPQNLLAPARNRCPDADVPNPQQMPPPQSPSATAAIPAPDAPDSPITPRSRVTIAGQATTASALLSRSPNHACAATTHYLLARLAVSGPGPFQRLPFFLPPYICAWATSQQPVFR
jgi:hypothetical protein